MERLILKIHPEQIVYFLSGGGSPHIDPLTKVEEAFLSLIEDVAIYGLGIPESEEELVKGVMIFFLY